MKMQGVIKDSKGTSYYDFDYKNGYGWFMPILHKLHSSKTLNRLVSGGVIQHELLEPLRIYASLNENNYATIDKAIKNWLTKGYLTEDNHDSSSVLYYYYLPVIHEFYKNKFQDIIDELNIEYINTIETTIRDNIYTNIIRNNNNRCESDKIYTYYMNMISDKNYKTKSEFVDLGKDDSISYVIFKDAKYKNFSKFTAGILIIGPNMHNTNLYSICMVKTELDYVILDGSNSRMNLISYIYTHRMNNIVIKDISNNEVCNLNSYLKALRIEDQIEPTVFGYKLIFRNGDSNYMSGLSGGIANRKILFYIFIIFIVIVVIIVVLKHKEIKTTKLFQEPFKNNYLIKNAGHRSRY